jgi:replicative DNA helicase
VSTPLRSRRDGGSSSGADGLVPPHSVEAEQSVLGALLIDGHAWDQVADIVTSADFYRSDHRMIFEALGELVAGGRPGDVVTVSEQLERHGRLIDAGGLAYLGTLARDTPTAANARTYAQIVRERALLRRLLEAGREIASSVFSDEGQSARELVDNAERRVFEIAEMGARGHQGAVRVSALLPSLIDKIDEWHSNPDKLRGLPTGFTDFDKKTGGLRGGDLIIVAGRPSMGKSTLAVNMAEYAAVNPEIRARVAIFTMEMPSEQIVTRMLSSIGHVPLNSMRSGQISDDDWVRITAATSQLSEARIFLDETPALTPTELRARSRRIAREQGGLDLIIIDYLQLMQVQGNKENRATEIAEISRGLKALAKELNVPVIALSQLNRGVEQRQEKKPVMSDLRECVTGDTLVSLTDGRRVPIQQLVGSAPEVWSLDASQRLHAARADKVWHVGRKSVFRVELASGRNIRATAEHRLLAGAGWTTVAELKLGDRLALARRVPPPTQCTSWPDNWLILLGHLVGDGSYLSHQPLRYTTDSEENSALVRAAAESFGSTVSRHEGPTGTWHQLVISGNGNRWAPAGVGAWLKKLGIFNQRSHEKHLPAEVFSLPDEQISTLLRHLWATDGSITVRKPGQRGSPRVYFSTCSRRLAMDVAALLMRLEIIARIRTVHSGKSRPWYTVDVSGWDSLLRFAMNVSAHGPRMNGLRQLERQLWDTVANTNVDTLPVEAMERVTLLMEEQGISRTKMAGMRGLQNINIDHEPSRTLIREYADILDDAKLRDLAGNDVFWDRVIAIASEGEHDVYDLTVPGPANWLADGVVTHNSGAIEQDADMILLIYRDEVYEKNTTKKGMAEIDLAKHRNGEIGPFLLTFQGQYARFVNYAPDTYAEGVLR